MGSYIDFVTIVNRTSRTLIAMWDGKEYKIPSGPSSHPRVVADAVKRQNPIMGSDDPVTGQLQYLVGIKEEGDPVTPVEQSDEIELYNRKNLRNPVPIMIVPGNTGLYSVRRAEVSTALPEDSTFVKP